MLSCFHAGIVVRNMLVTYDRKDHQIGFLKTNCQDLWSLLPADTSPPVESPPPSVDAPPPLPSAQSPPPLPLQGMYYRLIFPLTLRQRFCLNDSRRGLLVPRQPKKSSGSSNWYSN